MPISIIHTRALIIRRFPFSSPPPLPRSPRPAPRPAPVRPRFLFPSFFYRERLERKIRAVARGERRREMLNCARQEYSRPLSFLQIRPNETLKYSNWLLLSRATHARTNTTIAYD